MLGVDRLVLANASHKAICVRAKNWCESSNKFLSRFADAGNLEACYFLGMVSIPTNCVDRLLAFTYVMFHRILL
jgi:hypothetical protein